ncbi:hypothetical protein LB534_05000 [Mesorhizobium sp. CA18]|uniref:hypothetical protein n=1 Tax=unclassified Mesorhizobium TaxID=325217 RepID=UPI001CCF62E4|nr:MULTISPECIES: hypothetical protein [unclassified Mesorhizobium]MBZ9734353.1 hypothetical protein [Mesorhizobium sp. CA9]MBZ9824634.1 hypothetical protein [Mesorhizobium sp. CA18]MBZ9829408.1 hypothetical protein [Mesorhizobium sp. CA2]MBZ9878002.1 hypothetical protein [Mesorhizobium sp. Ca11]MBZ9902880.1 hypothetical protein [Mesorhizobium sp. CA17]
MSVIDIPFDSQEINDPTTLRAVIEIDRGPRPEGFAPPQHAGSYGAVLWGRGDVLRFWRAGCAKSDDILRAAAVSRLLEARQRDATLLVHSKGLVGILDHVARSRGRTAGGKPFDGFDFLKPIQEARDRGEWRLVPFKARVEEPEGHHLAVQSARSGLRAALRRLPLLSTLAAEHKDPLNFIAATDADPDPDGLVSRLEAARG